MPLDQSFSARRPSKTLDCNSKPPQQIWNSQTLNPNPGDLAAALRSLCHDPGRCFVEEDAEVQEGRVSLRVRNFRGLCVKD